MAEIFLVYNYIAVIVFTVQLFVAQLQFCVFLRRRKRFLLRILLGFAVLVLLACPIGAVANIFDNSFGMRSLAIFVLSVALFVFCFKTDFIDVLFRCSCGVFLQNFAASMQDVLSDISGETGYNPLSVWMFISFICCYVLCWFLCARRLKGKHGVGVDKIFTLVMTLLGYVICDVVFTQSTRMPDMTHRILWQITLAFCDLFSLMLLFSVLNRKVIEEEKIILEQLVRENARKYELEQSTADIINMKCHDIKYHLDMLKLKDGEQNSVDEIKRAVSIYDNIAKTGNVALDLILSERSLHCEQYGIRFLYMADGQCLNRFALTDVAGIFGNLLDNAIEYLKSAPDDTDRVLNLQVSEKPQGVCIHVENPCRADLNFVNGLPKSTKGDDNYHGFGIKSVRYTVQKYGGNLVVNRSDNMFTVDIFIP